jgi:hypothetical protein
LDVFLSDERHLAVDGELGFVGVVTGDLNGFVAFRERAIRGETGPIPKEGMPDGDVLDVFVLGADVGNERLQATGEGFGLRFEVVPAVLPLAITAIVDVLCPTMSVISFLIRRIGSRGSSSGAAWVSREHMTPIKGKKERKFDVRQLSSMMRLEMLILFSASVSRALRTFSSVNAWPREFQVPGKWLEWEGS